MASRIFNIDSVGSGYRASLLTGENVWVRSSAMVASEDSVAIYGSGSTMVANILGEVVGEKTGISFGQAATHSSNKILIAATGYVAGFTSAISMTGYSGSIENRGSIWSSGTAISVKGNGAGDYTTKITNMGAIEGNIGIRSLGVNSLSFTNTGTLSADEDSYAYQSDANSYDKLVNKGTITGNISLGAGNDLLSGAFGTLNGDIYGGDGNDTIEAGKGSGDIFGEAGNDTITGGGGRGTISGGDGNDTISGGATLFGDDGNDVLRDGTKIYGGAGNDIIGNPDSGSTWSESSFYGGEGDDTYYAGEGSDEESAPKVFEAAGEGDDTIYVFRSYKLAKDVEVEHLIAGRALYNIYNPTNIKGNNLAQSITGSEFADTLDGGGGKDTLTGLGGNDTYVINGSDKVVEAANGGIDLVKSSATYKLAANVENLVLTGSSAINGTGNGLANTLTGNNANNTLAGGQDTITDFNQKQKDKIDLSGIDADSSTTGNQVFLFKGTEAFSGAKGELRYEKLATGTYIYADVNGDKIADLAIHLSSSVKLVAGDFVL